MMHPRTSLLRGIIGAAIFSLPLLLPAPRADAGTTGSLIVTVTYSEKGIPLQGVTVAVSSPSQTDKGTTDAAGRVTFASLAPDTYEITFSKQGYDTGVIAGVDV